MRVEVRYFASLADRSGCAAESIEIAPGTDVAGLWRELLGRHPALGACGFRPLVACDRAYASWERALDGVHEVAFLPPVSGG
jgi:molybdopterin converting factor small subunit